MDGAAVVLMPRLAHREMVCASDDTVERIEELQGSLGEGPSVEAFDSGGSVLVADVAADDGTRWPMFAEAIGVTSVGSIFSFPLQIGVIRLGVMDLYRREPAPLTRDEFAAALRVSELVTSAILTSADGGSENWTNERWLEQSSLSRDINQATGMVLAQLEVTAEEALVRLRAHAFSQDRRIGDVARDVVARRLRFDPDAA